MEQQISQIMKLNEETLESLKKHKRARRALEDLWDVSFSTIQRWLTSNDPMLCNLSSLSVIGSYLEKDISDMVIQDEIDFKNVQ